MATLVKDRFGSTEQLKVPSSSSFEIPCFLNKYDVQYSRVALQDIKMYTDVL